jgi:hypothetical protein
VGFLDFWTSQTSGFHGLWIFWIQLFQDSWISGFLHFRILQVLDFKIPRFPGLGMSGLQEFEISGFMDLWNSGFRDFRICGFWNFWIEGFQDFQILGFRTPPAP